MYINVYISVQKKNGLELSVHTCWCNAWYKMYILVVQIVHTQCGHQRTHKQTNPQSNKQKIGQQVATSCINLQPCFFQSANKKARQVCKEKGGVMVSAAGAAGAVLNVAFNNTLPL